MFISVLELFKIGIGPSSSHTIGPMVAAGDFISRCGELSARRGDGPVARVRCILKGSLAYTGKGHATDRAVVLGLHGHKPEAVAFQDVDAVVDGAMQADAIDLGDGGGIGFSPREDIVFDYDSPIVAHPNEMVFELVGPSGEMLLTETYYSIGGGFICTGADIHLLEAPLKMVAAVSCRYPFDSAESMLEMALDSGLSIAQMKRINERVHHTKADLKYGMETIWESMRLNVERGLVAEGALPGGLELPRRAKGLHDQLVSDPGGANVNEWLCAYAIAVSEENAAGRMVVTAPTNGAAGVIPAVLYNLVTHEKGTVEQVQTFLLTAAAIGGIIKHRSSISGAEVGCQGEVGSAAAMAAAGLCAARGGSPQQIENAAEIALEHHLGMTCDPVKGLVQVPCIERNGFGAIKAHTAASLALRGSGRHFVLLDNCIAAMKQTGLEMSDKFKETSLGGLAVSLSEC
ncbi:MAG: L-serine ammonia-lyase [Desulfobacteraceae bacterium]